MKRMLDSGAYGAFERGETLDVTDYIRFLRDTAELWDSYINLDVIPQTTDQDNLEQAAKASYGNLQTMKDAGLAPMAVFHYGEKWRWLERMLRDGETYIGLSPRDDMSTADKIRWLDDCFTILDAGKGQPELRVHGLGVMTPDLIRRFPWTTVDATTWALKAVYGLIVVPRYNAQGEPDYSLPPFQVGVTTRSSHYLHHDGDKLKPWQRSHVDRHLATLGIDVARTASSVVPRFKTWVWYYVGLGCQYSVPIAFSTSNACRNKQKVLREGGASHSMDSYYDLRSCSPEKIERLYT